MSAIKRDDPVKGCFKNNLSIFFIGNCYCKTLNRNKKKDKKDESCYEFKLMDNTPALLLHVY